MIQKSFKTLTGKLKLAALVCGTFFCNTANAQTLGMPPGNLDQLWYNVGGLQPLSLNTAAIAYNDGPMSPDQGLYVAVSPVPTLTLPFTTQRAYNSINLMNRWGAQVQCFSTDTTQNSGTDVTIGNTDGTRGKNVCNDFIVAVSYPDVLGVPTVDFYDATAMPLTITYLSSLKLAGYDASIVHIDVIAEYNNLVGCGNPLPFCGKFMLTWDDHNTGHVYVAQGNLNTQSLMTPIQDLGTGYSPDVAGVQRKPAPIMPIQNVAYVTYMDGSYPGVLMLDEWRVGTPPFPPVMLDAGVTGTSFFGSIPRIDAMDDYNTMPSSAQYKVVISALNGATPNPFFEIRTYDNVVNNPGFVSSQFEDFMSCADPAPYHNMHPAISVWGNSHFAVLHTESPVINPNYPFPPPLGPKERLVVEPIDLNSATTYWNNHYYKVNGMGCSQYNAPDFRSSASACPNYLSIQQPMVFAWADYNPGVTVNQFTVQYKFSMNAPGVWSTTFKSSNTNSVAEVTSADWQISPNPTTDVLSVTSPTGTVANDYSITDATGRVMLRGALGGSSSKINVNGLANGVYFIKVKSADQNFKVIEFLKN